MTSITATHHPGGASSPDSFEVTVLGPDKPVSAYASNFTSGVDSWSAFGTGAGLTNRTDKDPDALQLNGPAVAGASVHCARVVSGLTVGAHYRFSAYCRTAPGLVHLAVREASEGTEIAQTTNFNASRRALISLDFTATITNQVIEFFLQPAYFSSNAPYLYVDTVKVDPVSWLGTNIYRTDANGEDVPVRNPKPYDIEHGTLGVTIYDFEAAMVGPVHYRVVDGLGGTAECTATAQDFSSNRAVNPLVYPFTAGSTGWAGTGATLTTPSNAALRATITTATATDLAQKVSTPTPVATGYLTKGEYEVGDAFRVSVQGRCSLASVAGATITMRQVLTGFNGTSGTTNTNLNLSVTPTTGDVLIVHCQMFANPSTLTAVSGCGATWTRIGTSFTGGGSSASDWFMGTGANATGTITTTYSTSKNVSLRAWLVGGLTATTTNLTQSRATSSGTSWTGTANNAQAGQIVLQTTYSGVTSGTYSVSQTPSSGWTNDTLNQDAIRGSHQTGYRIPTELTPTSHNATLTTSGSNFIIIENLVLGVAVTPSTPTPHLKTRLTWYDVGGSVIEAHDSNVVTVSDVLWADMILDTTIPATADGFRIDTGIEGTVTRTVGDWFELRYMLAGRPGAFFYGDTTSTADFDYDWSGDPFASPSLEISTAPVADQPPSLTLPATALQANNTSPPDFALLTMATDFNEAIESPVAVHTVLGRSDKLSNPAPMLDRAGTFTLWCQTYSEAKAVRELLRSPQTALFRQANFEGMDLYFVARLINVSPLEPTPTRHWMVVVTYDEVPRPS